MPSRAQQAFAHLPLHFEPNRGQAPASTRYLARTPGAVVTLEDASAVFYLRVPESRPSDHFALRSHDGLPRPASLARFELRYLNANPRSRLIPERKQEGRSHYLRGTQPSSHLKNVSQYCRVRYASLYPGIDLVFYGNHSALEYDFVVAPGADPSRIQMEFNPSGAVSLGEDGSLEVSSRWTSFRMRRPLAFQTIGGRRRVIPAAYRLDGRRLSFELAPWDRTQPLVIDPVLEFSTLFGGSGYDEARAVGTDSAGNVYIAGHTQSANLPTVTGSYDTLFSGTSDAFVAKLNPSGSALIYSTFIGGVGEEWANGLAVHPNGGVYLVGSTSSLDFPRVNAFQNVFGGVFDGFALRLAANGASLVYSTYLGGASDDYAIDAALNTATGNLAIVGRTFSSNFPILNAGQTNNAGLMDNFIVKLNASGARIFSTYLGGSDQDRGSSVALDAAENVYVAGGTLSANFPTTGGAWDRSHGGSVFDGFASKLSADGQTLVYSTFLGGSLNDEVEDLVVDSAGQAHAVGFSESSDFPTTVSGFNRFLSGDLDAFATKLNAAGSTLLYSTFLGGSRTDRAWAAVLDPATGNLWVAGATTSGDFPLVSSIQGFRAGAVSNLFRSSDGGVSWSQGAGIDRSVVYTVSPNPVNVNSAIAGVEGGAFYSSDGGFNWFASNVTSGTVVVVARAPSSSAYLYLAAYTRIARSTNGGAYWTVLTDLPREVNALAVSPANRNTVYAGTDQGGVYVSTNGGSNWSQSNTGLDDLRINDLQIDPSNASIVYAATPLGVYKSLNGGSTWFPSNVGLPPDPAATRLSISASQPSTLLAIVSRRLYRSTNAGGSWALAGAGLTRDPVRVAIAPSNASIVYVGTDRGVFRSADGGVTFAPANTGMELAGVTALAAYPSNPNLVYAGLHIPTDTFLAELNSSGSALAFSTYLGGTGEDLPTSLARLVDGSILMAGHTNSRDFPTTTGAFQRTLSGRDAFVARISKANPSCSYALAPPSETYTVGGGTYAVNVVTRSGCTWSATSTQSWLRLTGSTSGTGTRTLTYVVDPNPGPARQAQILAGGQTFQLTQEGQSGCSYSLTPSSTASPAVGGLGAFDVVTGAECSWTALANAAWITVVSNPFGAGNGQVSFTVAANLNGSPRNGTINVNGQLFTVNQAAGSNSTAGPLSLAPALGAVSSQTFAARFGHAGGVANIAWVELLIGASPGGAGQPFCFVHYDVAGNGLWLYSDIFGFFLGPVTPGAASNRLQGSLCALNTGAASILPSGTELTLNAPLTFKQVGPGNVYLRGYSKSGVDTGWVRMGGVNVTPAPPAPDPTVSPSSGSGANPAFALTYTDPTGFSGFAFGWTQFLIAAAPNGGGQPFCYLHYDRAANRLWMYSSDVGFFVGPVAPGAASNLLNSSACSVNTAGSTAVAAGGKLTLTVPFTLKSPLKGAKFLYQRTLDALLRDSGWLQTGSWTIP